MGDSNIIFRFLQESQEAGTLYGNYMTDMTEMLWLTCKKRPGTGTLQAWKKFREGPLMYFVKNIINLHKRNFVSRPWRESCTKSVKLDEETIGKKRLGWVVLYFLLASWNLMNVQWWIVNGYMHCCKTANFLKTAWPLLFYVKCDPLICQDRVSKSRTQGNPKWSLQLCNEKCTLHRK